MITNFNGNIAATVIIIVKYCASENTADREKWKGITTVAVQQYSAWPHLFTTGTTRKTVLYNQHSWRRRNGGALRQLTANQQTTWYVSLICISC